MACYIQKPEYIQQYYVKEAWIDYDKPAQKCLKIFHLLNTKGLKHLGKDDLTDAVLEVNNGVSDELRPDVLTYMNSIWDISCVSMVGSWGTSNVTLDSIVEFVKDMSRGNSSLGVVALDPFYRFVEGDENSNEDVQETINKLMPLKQRMTVIYTHHTKKNSMDKDPLTNGSGAGSHGRAADISMGLSGDNAKGFHLRYSGREDLGGITLSRDEYGFFVQSEAKESETGYKTELDDDTWAQIAEYVGDRTVSMTAFRKKFGNIDYDLLRSHGYVVEKSSGNYKIRKRTNMSKG